MLLELKQITTYQGFTRAIENISMRVEENEIVSLLGANGAGKTTLLLTISGVLKPRSGKIIFQKNEIQGLPPHRIVKLGISQSPEDRKLFGKMTVLKNLRLGSYVRRMNKKDIELYPRMDLGNFSDSQRAGRPDGCNAQRRRAKNVVHCPGTHGQAPNSGTRRAVSGSRTQSYSCHHGHGSIHQSGRHDHFNGRTERFGRSEDLASRVCVGERTNRDRGYP